MYLLIASLTIIQSRTKRWKHDLPGWALIIQPLLVFFNLFALAIQGILLFGWNLESSIDCVLAATVIYTFIERLIIGSRQVIKRYAQEFWALPERERSKWESIAFFFYVVSVLNFISAVVIVHQYR